MKDNFFYKYGRRYYYAIKGQINHWRNTFFDLNPKLLILAYHRVLPEVRFNPLNTIVSLDTFTRQIDFLTGRYPVISISDAIKQCEAGEVKDKIQIALTFDDGFLDNYEIVFPLFKKKGLPAAFFPSTDFVGRNRVLNSSREKTQGEGDRCMDWQQLREMSEAGMEIGSHGISHSSLAMIPYEDAVQEIRESKKIIEDNIGKECLHFAFPYGSRIDYNQALISAVQEAGFRACLLNIHGYNHIERDSFCFKRIIMEESTDLRYLLG